MTVRVGRTRVAYNSPCRTPEAVKLNSGDLANYRCQITGGICKNLISRETPPAEQTKADAGSKTYGQITRVNSQISRAWSPRRLTLRRGICSIISTRGPNFALVPLYTGTTPMYRDVSYRYPTANFPLQCLLIGQFEFAILSPHWLESIQKCRAQNKLTNGFLPPA